MEERADDVDVGAEPRHVGGGGKRANHKALDAGLGLPRLLLLKCRAQQLVRYLAALLMRNHTHFAQAFAPHQLVRMVLGRRNEDQRPELVAAVLLHQLTQVKRHVHIHQMHKLVDRASATRADEDQHVVFGVGIERVQDNLARFFAEVSCLQPCRRRLSVRVGKQGRHNGADVLLYVLERPAAGRVVAVAHAPGPKRGVYRCIYWQVCTNEGELALFFSSERKVRSWLLPPERLMCGRRISYWLEDTISNGRVCGVVPFCKALVGQVDRKLLRVPHCEVWRVTRGLSRYMFGGPASYDAGTRSSCHLRPPSRPATS
mmetsp:Transcript_32021/g.70072  ORF Transcript_32021/g.70072 Transcript_32021/m.70072 type:complete len:316 (+) Transcript_32021:2125-3072(+)